MNSAIDGPDSFAAKREAIDEFGWRHFGDIYADHEAVYATGPKPTTSHYNNQYDAVYGFGVQFVRSGDVRWLEAMNELAAHVADIDVYHTDGDKSAYNHGMFWHTCHYVPADTGTHRAYPARFTKGGGPNAGHLYTSGLVLHYYMTGDPLSRDTAVELGRYVIDADDGRRTIFRWLSRGFTGNVTHSAAGYHGPGRASANAVNALLDAHRLTGEPEFLDKAEALIRRCIHPADDPDAMGLLNAETRWFYTMFLQVLGKYLDRKAELGQVDDRYAYAQASLVHYARWMARNERPYLDRPEELEYPTETWAAQDIRKSDVFGLAARHARGDDRTVFLERCEWFFRYSVQTLAKMETRTLARPVVLLLSNGLVREYLRSNPESAAPTALAAPGAQADGFGSPTRFVPQKDRAIRRAKAILAGGLAAVLVGIALAVARWLI